MNEWRKEGMIFLYRNDNNGKTKHAKKYIEFHRGYIFLRTMEQKINEIITEIFKKINFCFPIKIF